MLSQACYYFSVITWQIKKSDLYIKNLTVKNTGNQGKCVFVWLKPSSVKNFQDRKTFRGCT